MQNAIGEFGTGLNELKRSPFQTNHVGSMPKIPTDKDKSCTRSKKKYKAICNLCWSIQSLTRAFFQVPTTVRKLMRHLHVWELLHLELFRHHPRQQCRLISRHNPSFISSHTGINALILAVIFPVVTSTVPPLLLFIGYFETHC